MIGQLKDQLSKDKLLRHGAMLMSAAVVSHICNIVFQAIMGRTLGAAEYALLTALLGFANMAALPLGAISTAVNHSTSWLIQQGREGDVARLVRKWLLRMGGVGTVLFAGCVLFSGEIAGFVHLDRVAPVVVMGLVLVLVFASAPVGGAIGGLQMFGAAMAGQQFSSIIRLVAATVFIHVLAQAAGWGLMGHAVGLGVNLAFQFIMLWRRLHGHRKTNQPVPSIRFYAALSFVVLFSFSYLLRADIILVKHYLPGDVELFAYATTIGHIVIFLPMPLARAMFPKVVSQGTSSRKHRIVLVKSMAYTAACVFPAAIGCSVAGWIPLRILYGIQDPGADLLKMVSLMGWVMAPTALLNITMYYHLAQKRFLRTIPVVVFAMAYFAGAALFHSTIWQLLLVAMCSTWGCLAVVLVIELAGIRFGRHEV